jgi:hypothetical protein
LKLFQEWGERRIKKSSVGGKFNYAILYIVRTFANATMYPQPEQEFFF